MDVVLSKDEQVIKDTAFRTNLFLFWFKSSYVLTNKRVIIETPNTYFLGIIPIGKIHDKKLLKDIYFVSRSTNLSFWRLVIGLIFILVGISKFCAFGLLLILIGVANLLNSYTTTFVITDKAKQSIRYGVCTLEKKRMEAFVDEVNEVLNTNKLLMHSYKINAPISSLNQADLLFGKRFKETLLLS